MEQEASSKIDKFTVTEAATRAALSAEKTLAQLITINDFVDSSGFCRRTSNCFMDFQSLDIFSSSIRIVQGQVVPWCNPGFRSQQFKENFGSTFRGEFKVAACDAILQCKVSWPFGAQHQRSFHLCPHFLLIACNSPAASLDTEVSFACRTHFPTLSFGWKDPRDFTLNNSRYFIINTITWQRICTRPWCHSNAILSPFDDCIQRPTHLSVIGQMLGTVGLPNRNLCTTWAQDGGLYYSLHARSITLLPWSMAYHHLSHISWASTALSGTLRHSRHSHGQRSLFRHVPDDLLELIFIALQILGIKHPSSSFKHQPGFFFQMTLR